MRQEFGETVDAICEDDERLIQRIVHANRQRTEPYWIVIAAKPSKVAAPDGSYIIMRHFKPQRIKPPPMVGTIIIEVNNATGQMKWEVNPLDVPIDYRKIGARQNGTIPVETSIPQAYIYN